MGRNFPQFQFLLKLSLIMMRVTHDPPPPDILARTTVSASQLRMRDIAEKACASGSGLPARYWRYARVWTLLGVAAFSAMLVVYWLMVSKPV